MVLAAPAFAVLSLQLGAQGRIVMPHSKPVPRVDAETELDGIFFPGDPTTLLGGAVRLSGAPLVSLEAFGSYADYDPEVSYSPGYEGPQADFRSGAWEWYRLERTGTWELSGSPPGPSSTSTTNGGWSRWRSTPLPEPPRPVQAGPASL
ncbi:MAG: hypothetical protein R6U36_11155 [Candidatus Fermentibacteraceae bacterium]